MAYFRPQTIQKACELLQKHKGKVIAGGTDLVVRMDKGFIDPENIIDISWLPLNSIEVLHDGAKIIIGALKTMSDLSSDETIKKMVPLLSMAANDVAAPQIRNRATIGGNIVNASPAADGVCALATYNPQFEVWGVSGSRLIDFNDFFKAPGKTALGADEILARIHISMVKPNEKVREINHWFKLGNRTAQVISIVAFAGRTWVDENDTVIESRFAVASVAPVPYRVSDAEKLIAGRVLNKETIDLISEKVGESVKPISDLRGSGSYRRHLAEVFARRHLTNVEENRGGALGISQDTPREKIDGNSTTVSVSKETIEFILNGKKAQFNGDQSVRLLDTLRNYFGFMGTKDGCGEGECGACTILIDGQPVNACMVLTGNIEGKIVTTIEGLSASDGSPGLIQQSFIQAGAVQCGFCIPGFEMTVHHFINKNKRADRESIKKAISGNLCRCTGYVKIIDAVELAMKKRWEDK
jgi:xanthine dehydrogenase iron-sulfur cluster and FAD-binding subunit A